MCMTHCLHVFDISARLFKNTSRNDKDTERTQPPLHYMGLWLTFKFDLDLQATNLCLVHDTLSLGVWHFCQVIWKSLKKWQRYRADKTTKTTSAVPGIMTFTSKCDLDLWAMDLGPVLDTSSSCVWHFCQVILKSLKKWQSYRADTTTIAVQCIMNLTLKCDHDLRATDLGLVRDKLS
jgi:hypothetical protein